MYKRYFVLILVVCYCSCKNDKGIVPVKGCDPPVQVSYQRDIQPIFNTYCVSGCHSGPSPERGLNLEASVSYAQLSNGYVDTLDPNNSLLHFQMNNASNIMPPSGKLDQCTLDLIDKWMEQKAKNN